MAELDRSLSQLDPTLVIPTGSLLLVSVEDQQSASGYSSRKISSENVGSQLLTAYNYNTLNTTAKNPIGAINELKGKELTSTLTAGQTTVTFSDAAITTSSTIDIYVDKYGISPEDVTVTAGQVQIIFEAQSSDLGIKVVIK